MYITGEELFQLHGLHDLRGVKKEPNVQVIMLGQDGRKRECLEINRWIETHIYTSGIYS